MSVTLRGMTEADWPSVAAIYLEGIMSGRSTFQTEIPGYAEWDRLHLPCCRLVAVEGEEVVGWSAFSPTSPRWCYRGVVEISYYVARAHWGRGIGHALLEEAIRRSEEAGIWTIQAVVLEENYTSIAALLGAGFRMVGYREAPARDLGGVWRNTTLFERRSHRVGID